MHLVKAIWLLEEYVVGFLGSSEHGTGVAVNELLNLEVALLIKNLKVFNNPSILILNMPLVLFHELLNVRDLPPVLVELQLVQPLLLALADVAPLGVADCRLEHVAVHV